MTMVRGKEALGGRGWEAVSREKQKMGEGGERGGLMEDKGGKGGLPEGGFRGWSWNSTAQAGLPTVQCSTGGPLGPSPGTIW